MSKPKKSATPIDIEQLARDKINNKYAIVKLGELTFEPCDIIEELDLIA